MTKKRLIPIAGALCVAMATLSGCSQGTEATHSTAIHQEEAGRPPTATGTGGAPSETNANTDASQDTNVSDGASSTQHNPQEIPDAPTPNNAPDTMPDRTDLVVPEGMVISTPPTQVEIPLPDGATIPILIHGNPLDLSPMPVMLGGEVFVPVFGVFEYVNRVYPFAVQQTDSGVRVSNPHVSIEVAEGTGTLTRTLMPSMSQIVMDLPMPPQTVDGMLMQPLRPVIEAMGVELEWDEVGGAVHLFIPEFAMTASATLGGGETVTIRPVNPYR
ncbi:MAG: copper amine oxidase N-terminal domain-containing protein [Defluviitaleaceae bacterium]|nr:copper amine oxidase N-terminal domain-containing protein [Defluviitaleaceae bacterium]